MISSIRSLIQEAEKLDLSASEIDFMIPHKIEDALTKTREDLEFNAAVRFELPVQDETLFLERRNTLDLFIKLIESTCSAYTIPPSKPASERPSFN